MNGRDLFFRKLFPTQWKHDAEVAQRRADHYRACLDRSNRLLDAHREEFVATYQEYPGGTETEARACLAEFEAAHSPVIAVQQGQHRAA